MRVLILGGDGYLGWPTAMRFSGKGHDVAVVDNFARRRWHEQAGTDSLTPIALAGRPHLRLARGVGQADRIPHRRHLRGHVHRGHRARLHARHDHPLRRAAQRPLVDAERRPRGDHPAGQRDRHAQAAVGDARVRARGTPGQAGHDGRVRHAQHRHRRGLHRDRAQGAQGHPAVPQGAGLVLPPVQGARQPQHPLRLPDLGHPRHRPQPGRRLRHRDAGDEAGRAAGHALRLRPGLRHGAQPLLRAGHDRPPADGLRQGRPDPRHPEHRGHDPVRRADRRQPRRRRASSASTTSSPSRSRWPGWPRRCATPAARSASR